jgi:hypothetical protein
MLLAKGRLTIALALEEKGEVIRPSSLTAVSLYKAARPPRTCPGS